MTAATQQNVVEAAKNITPHKGISLVQKFAMKYSIEPDKLLGILKATAFKQKKDVAVTNEQMAALLIVADQHGLNPFTREIFAFPDKQNGIVPVVGVDGWSRISNNHPQFNGMSFNASTDLKQMDTDAKMCPEWMEVIIYRKDREHPIVVREYLDEVYRPPFKGNDYVTKGPWQSHTKRMLRHKTMIQGLRIAFGFAGVYDEDEAERIIEGEIIEHNDFQSAETRSINDSILNGGTSKADAPDGQSAAAETEETEQQGEEFELEQPAETGEPSFTLVDVKAKLKAIAEKVKKAKKPDHWLEINDMNAEALDLLNSVQINADTYKVTYKELEVFMKQAEKELGA